MMPVTLVLRTGGDYNISHIARLSNQILDSKVRVITDIRLRMPGNFALEYDWPGWWSKMEMFRPDIRGDLFYMDLDTTIRSGLVARYMRGPTTLLRDFYRPHGMQSSVMYLTEADRHLVWYKWMSEGPENVMARFRERRPGLNGDQNFLEEVLPNALRWQDRFPREFVSYKVNMLREHRGQVPEGANVIVFHGKPRPWHVGM